MIKYINGKKSIFQRIKETKETKQLQLHYGEGPYALQKTTENNGSSPLEQNTSTQCTLPKMLDVGQLVSLHVLIMQELTEI